MKNYFFIFFVCLACFGLVDLPAQESSPQEQTQQEQLQEVQPYTPPTDPFLEEEALRRARTEPENFQAKFMNMLFLLGLIIAFMLLASWMLKRLSRNRIEQLNSTSSIRVLETRSLSARSTLYLIEVMDQRLVIAESHAGVHHIATIPTDQIT